MGSLSGRFKTLWCMAQNFLSCDREQVLLLPPDLSEWLPAGHLARFVIETVDQLDLSAVYGYYRQDGHGRPAFDPGMMVALVLYAYAVGVTSSRAIERRCVDDVAFRVITANRQPDHATIARFLVRHREALQQLFFCVLALCRRAGMVRVGTVAVDSTKLAANASADQNRTYEALRKEAERIIEEAIATDAREDELYGEKRGDELPEELADPRTRKARIGELLEQARREQEQAKAEREERVARHDEHRARTGKRLPGRQFKQEVTDRERVIQNKKYNLTDPDSGIVRHRGMRMQGYNVQAAVGDGQVILATSVSRVSPDGGQLVPTIELARANLDRCGITEAIEQVLADSGYWQTKQITELKQTGVDVLVAPLIRARNLDRANPEVQAMAARLQSDEGKASYGRRQQIVEPVFAHIKHIRGITRVLRRGKAAVQAEVDLIATTHNLLKLHRHTTLASA
jgi:transposase